MQEDQKKKRRSARRSEKYSEIIRKRNAPPEETTDTTVKQQLDLLIQDIERAKKEILDFYEDCAQSFGPLTEETLLMDRDLKEEEKTDRKSVV